ncbi:hypothetical protein Hanom_Chr16g01505811 [Helianthus anomalus]
MINHYIEYNKYNLCVILKSLHLCSQIIQDLTIYRVLSTYSLSSYKVLFVLSFIEHYYISKLLLGILILI